MPNFFSKTSTRFSSSFTSNRYATLSNLNLMSSWPTSRLVSLALIFSCPVSALVSYYCYSGVRARPLLKSRAEYKLQNSKFWFTLWNTIWAYFSRTSCRSMIWGISLFLSHLPCPDILQSRLFWTAFYSLLKALDPPDVAQIVLLNFWYNLYRAYRPFVTEERKHSKTSYHKNLTGFHRVNRKIYINSARGRTAHVSH